MTERPIPGHTATGYRSPMTNDIFTELDTDSAPEGQPEPLLHAFVTMQAAANTSVFSWMRNVEELRACVAGAIGVTNWRSLRCYGPDSDGFSTPGVCIEARVTAAEYGQILRAVHETMWLDLNVDVHRVVG